jgi:predicted nucleic acid-binding protein
VYTIDTNIIIYYGNGDPSVQLFINEQLANRVPLYISAATEHELFSYAHLTDREADYIDELLDTMTGLDHGIGHFRPPQTITACVYRGYRSISNYLSIGCELIGF